MLKTSVMISDNSNYSTTAPLFDDTYMYITLYTNIRIRILVSPLNSVHLDKYTQIEYEISGSALDVNFVIFMDIRKVLYIYIRIICAERGEKSNSTVNFHIFGVTCRRKKYWWFGILVHTIQNIIYCIFFPNAYIVSLRHITWNKRPP